MHIEQERKKVFICCKCGKRLMERLPDGTLHFLFGKKGDFSSSPVDILIRGNVRIRCLKRSCKEWTDITLLPNSFQSGDPKFSVNKLNNKEKRR